MAKIGVVYATGSKMVRRIVKPSREEQLSLPGWVGEGETMLVMEGEPSRERARVAVREATGVTPPEIVCAVVNRESKVESMVMADPALDDRFPNVQVVEAYSPEITVGCTFDPATGLFTVPARVVPAYTDKLTGVQVPARVEPERVIEKS